MELGESSEEEKVENSVDEQSNRSKDSSIKTVKADSVDNFNWQIGMTPNVDQ